MYDIVHAIIGHDWVTNYTSDQQYIYYICGALVVIIMVVLIDLVYRIFRHFWR